MTTHALEQALERVGGRCRDESFARGLYRALAGRRWRREDGVEASLSPTRAEELVNGMRRAVGYETLALARSGGEGRLTDDVRDELAAQGWRSEPLDGPPGQPGHSPGPAPSPPAERPRPAT